MRAVSLTNRGGRKNNEDSVGYAQSEDLWCFVICDGLGGQSFGEVASELVCSTICSEFKKDPHMSQQSLHKYIEKAASALGKKRSKDEEKSDMSSTVVALLTDGKNAIWANIGDSRLYYISDYEISQVTNDHSIAFIEFENGDITYDEIRYSRNQNKLLRAVSDVDNLNPDISQLTKLKKNDAFLLCSDGFWEFVTEDDMETTLRQAKSPKEWLEAMLEILHANESKKNDNYSVIAVMI